MDVNLINVMTLAYLGDALYEVYIREHLIKNGIAKVEDLQKRAVDFVSAKSQAKILDYLLDNNMLSEDEIDIETSITAPRAPMIIIAKITALRLIGLSG